jgi:outer membrane biosynthesis protein TonB
VSSGALEPVYKPREIALAFLLAFLVEAGILLIWIYAGAGSAHVAATELEAPKEVPIKVKPVVDETPLLKLGGKKKAKLPDMWKKQAPVQRFEESSAPSAKASKSPESIPSSKLAPLDASAPPPDAETAKQVDQTLTDAAPDAAPTVEGEGSADGVKEGTEADPLKARAVSAYYGKLQGWFNARFRPPSEGAPCAELKKLGASVVVTVGGDRSVAGYSIVKPSGNPSFDANVRSMLDGARGEQLPPPPPLYPDILGQSLPLRLSGQNAKCNDTPSQPSPPAPSEPAPEPAP